MDRTDAKQAGSPVLDALRRLWAGVQTRPVPDYQPGPVLDRRQQRVQQYERVIDLLEQTRSRIAERGWTPGAWFSVPTASGTSGTDGGAASGGSAGARVGAGHGTGRRLVGVAEARAMLGSRPADLDSGCLVGTMLALAVDQDTAHTLDDVWRATDELYESMHERMGHHPVAAGHVHPPATRHTRLQALTGWNDSAGRTRGDVLDLVNRGIARSIVAACR